MKTLYIWEYWS